VLLEEGTWAYAGFVVLVIALEALMLAGLLELLSRVIGVLRRG